MLRQYLNSQAEITNRQTPLSLDNVRKTSVCNTAPWRRSRILMYGNAGPSVCTWLFLALMWGGQQSPNDIMALSPWCSLLVQTYHTEAVFWVTKLNILGGLFLEPSVSTVNALHDARTRVCMLRACMCCMCVTASRPPLAITAGCIWPTKSSSHAPEGSSIACRSKKEAAVIGCQLPVNVPNGGRDTYWLFSH